MVVSMQSGALWEAFGGGAAGGGGGGARGSEGGPPRVEMEFRRVEADMGEAGTEAGGVDRRTCGVWRVACGGAHSLAVWRPGALEVGPVAQRAGGLEGAGGGEGGQDDGGEVWRVTARRGQVMHMPQHCSSCTW